MGRKRAETRELRKRTLIYCEGETEQKYFTMLKSKYKGLPVDINVKKASDTAPGKMVDTLIEKKKYEKEWERIYVVFDKDRNSRQSLEKACKLAKENNITVLYTNECFELFILSHYKKIRTVHSSDMLYKKLELELGVKKYADLKGKDLNYLIDRIHIAEENCNSFSKDLYSSFDVNPYTNIGHYLKEIFYTKSL